MFAGSSYQLLPPVSTTPDLRMVLVVLLVRFRICCHHDQKIDYPRLPTRQYLPPPEFWAGCRSTLRVAAGSRRTNKATTTRQVEESLPRRLSLLSCIQFALEASLDAGKSKRKIASSCVSSSRPHRLPWSACRVLKQAKVALERRSGYETYCLFNAGVRSASVAASAIRYSFRMFASGPVRCRLPRGLGNRLLAITLSCSELV
jgi:hypothetical protein